MTYARPVELSGVWRAAHATDDLRRRAVEPGFDDGDWPEIAVPGHWRGHPEFVDSDGPVLYRHRFRQLPPDPGRRRWVTLDGVFYQADVWLDGAYLGDPEGYFAPHSFDVTALAALDTDHVLAVEATCSPQTSVRGKRNITGIFQHWDGLDRAWNPGGLWRPVRVHDTGPVRLARLRVLCRDADEARAHLLLTARLDSDTRRRVVLRTRVDGQVLSDAEHVLATGVNEVAWAVDVDRPQLWWPHSLGDQHLTDVVVDVLVDDEPSDRADRRTGCRTVAWNDWVLSVNGERLFLKGSNLLPTTAGLADATPEMVARDVELAIDAHLDVLRVHGHIARPELYDAADRAGLILIQDFPLSWGYARSVRRQAVEQAREAVDLLGHHPSIALWIGHNDPVAAGVGIEGDTSVARLRFLAGHQLPSWNKTVLDRWVKRSFEKADPTRSAVPHSGVLPHLPLIDGTDSHLYFGWYHGESGELGRLAARLPRLVRFVSELGAQSVPDSADFIDTSTWPDLDWETLATRHGLQRWVFDERVPPAEFATFDAWRDATQQYQADLLRQQVETLRRIKYRPTGGFCTFSFNDASPMVSWSVLDHQRRPKAGYGALRDSCAPVIVTSDWPPSIVAPGDPLELDLHVVNDLHQPLAPAVVTATLSWAGGERSWYFGGDVPSDECVKIGRVATIVPETLGSLRLELRFTAGDTTATNRYTTFVTVRPG
jgi:beta-mannosidase